MTTQTSKPAIGRTVHYMAYGTPGGEHPKACRAAMVTAVGDDPSRLDLCVFNPTGLFFNAGCPQDQREPATSRAGGTWHWPDLV